MSEKALQLIIENKETKATTLDLGNCGLTRVPVEVKELVWLEKIKFAVWAGERCDNPNNLISLENIEGLINLRSIDVAVMRELSSLTQLSSLIHLQEINCEYTQVSNLSPLSSLTNLQKINCSDTQVSDLSPLSSLTNLQEIICSYTQVSDLSPLSNLTQLSILHFVRTQINDLAPIANLANLQEINCS